MKKYRNEWKYICTNCDLELLKSRLSNFLNLDPYSNENGKYIIHCLYFDDYKNSCMKEVESGDFKRSKWRIRYYNDTNTTMYLERKEKLFGRCHKRKCKISTDEYNSIINGDYMNAFWNTKEELLKEFIVDIMDRKFRTKSNY